MNTHIKQKIHHYVKCHCDSEHFNVLWRHHSKIKTRLYVNRNAN